jgi:hypothetical protein
MRRGVVISVISIAVLLLVAGAAWYAIQFVPVDFIYGVEAEFEKVPPSDAELEKWVQAQPGVWKAFVERQQVGDQWRLIVTIGMTQNMRRDPPFPDLTRKCEELGYQGQHRPFRDQPR